MLKKALILTLVLLVFQLQAQQNEEIVTINGKILSAKDSTAVTANLLYEKLPYYDDMGMAASNGDAGFTLPLVKGNTYNFSITKDGFRKFSQEVTIDGEGELNAFYLEVDEVELIKLENLTFSTGSATITSVSHKELDELAAWMNENPSIMIRLEGHTDFRGNAQAQINLSQARVDAVKEYLEKKRVKKNRIQTRAFGGTRPLSREDTNEAKALNRRVEVRVIRR